MALIAGVDIGNSTTEIVIAEGKTPVAWARRSTRGQKGSEASVRAAEALLRNMERQNGMSTDRVIVAPWHPVTTEVATLHEAPPDTGNLQIINCANHSVAGNACAVGQPWNVSDIPPRGISLVAVVETGTGYRNAAALINRALEHGVSICGVIAADDEAVLIAARLTEKMPVVDRTNCQNALRARKLFVEVRPVGQCVSTATDVWALHSALETHEQDVAHLNLICRWVRDLSAVVIGLFDQPIEPQALHHMSTATWCTGESMDLIQAIPLLPGRLVGSVCVLNLGKPMQTSDVWGIDIDSVIENRGVRINGHLHRMALASMSTAAHASQVSISDIFTAPATVASSESEAASKGARTTPGCPEDALILDIGGGTIDLAGNHCEISAAGAGEMLSSAVAEVLNLPLGAADWVKRGPAQRVESAQTRLNENGSSDFVTENDMPAPSNAMGMLVTPGPVGLLPFGQDLQPSEWRIIRQSLKLEIIAKNVSRIINTYKEIKESGGADESFDIVVVGGPAEDDELLPALGRLPEIKGLGRGNVAGKLGHRFAVAYGLTQMA